MIGKALKELKADLARVEGYIRIVTVERLLLVLVCCSQVAVLIFGCLCSDLVVSIAGMIGAGLAGTYAIALDERLKVLVRLRDLIAVDIELTDGEDEK